MEKLGTRSWSSTEQFNEGDLVYVEAKVFDKSEKEKYSDFFPNRENVKSRKVKLLACPKSPKKQEWDLKLMNHLEP